MIPPDIKWQFGNAPKAELCHPDSRIIVWVEIFGKWELLIMHPHQKCVYWQIFWQDEKEIIWSLMALDKAYWAWWKSYH